jgi:uncharacterized protein YndB with AHSA1/START domain
MTDTTERSQTHATFVIERDYAAPVPAVWHALSDTEARAEWFGGGDSFTETENTHDFRVGGHASEAGSWHEGPHSRFLSTYTDIVEHERIVFTYDMWVDGRHMSTSLTTIALEPNADRTRLTYTEQGVHLDGLDSPAGREEGTAGLLDKLGGYLDAQGNAEAARSGN